jgi:hypothetical protein
MARRKGNGAARRGRAGRSRHAARRNARRRQIHEPPSIRVVARETVPSGRPHEMQKEKPKNKSSFYFYFPRQSLSCLVFLTPYYEWVNP